MGILLFAFIHDCVNEKLNADNEIILTYLWLLIKINVTDVIYKCYA